MLQTYLQQLVQYNYMKYDKLGLTINTGKTEYIVLGGDCRDLNISKGAVKGSSKAGIKTNKIFNQNPNFQN